MNQFTVAGREVEAESLKFGILINPKLPLGFMVTEHHERTREDLAFWWRRPFITTDDGSIEPAPWLPEPIRLEAQEFNRRYLRLNYPQGIAYTLWVLDGAEPCQPTKRGIFKSEADALASAQAWLTAEAT